jgi:hypothetical protein
VGGQGGLWWLVVLLDGLGVCVVVV